MREYVHAWNVIFEGLPKPFWNLKNHYPNLQYAWEKASLYDLQQIGLSKHILKRVREIRRTFDVKKELENVLRDGISVLIHNEVDYPNDLRNLGNHFPPGILYIKGDIAKMKSVLKNHIRIAIVGTRAMSEYGESMTRKIVQGLVHYSPVIISGMARGVDTVAHKEALKHGLFTIAVLGYGLNQIPHYLKYFTDKIQTCGVVLSEYPPNLPAQKYHFPLRNRIISGLSQVTTIIEAGKRSGALITAQYALDQGREIIAVPGDTNRTKSIGTNTLIKDSGAYLLTEPEDIIDLLKLDRKPNLNNKTYIGNELKIMNLLNKRPHNLGELSNKSTLNVPEFTTALTQLELTGCISKNHNGKYCAN
jgi:DNA processing protein